MSDPSQAPTAGVNVNPDGGAYTGPTPDPNSIVTPLDWARVVISQLGVPDTSANEQALVAWAATEGGNWHNTARFNPLGTTLQLPGSTVMAGGNSAGVQSYTSWQQGVQATVQMLQQANMSNILAALRSGNDAAAVAHAVGSSPWGTPDFSASIGGLQSYGSTTGGPGNTTAADAAGTAPAGVPAFDPNTQQPLTYLQALNIASRYPNVQWMLHIPDFSKILAYALQNGIDPSSSQIDALTQGTDWYKTHSDAFRSWAQTYGNDPAEASKRINDSLLTLEASAKTLGINPTQDQLNTLAINSLANGWSDLQIKQQLASLINTNTPADQQQGNVGYTISQMQAEAGKWLVPVSDQTLNQWAQNIASGTTDMNGFQAYLKTQAMSQWGFDPNMADAINRGIDPQTYLDPYKQKAASTLEISPDQINLEDPKYQKALLQTDPKTGARTVAPLWQWQQTLMSDPTYGYQSTQQGRANAASVAQTIGRMFGSTTGGTSTVQGVM